MSKRINLVGQKFERWTVLSVAPRTQGQSRWKCACSCGYVGIVSGQSLRSGTSKSCGCLKKELNDLTILPAEEKKQRRHKADKIRDQKPERTKEKAGAQLRYRITDKAALSEFRRWLVKKNKTSSITDDEYVKLRDIPCHKCGNMPERTGVCFILIDNKRPVELYNIKITCGICKLIKPKEQFDLIQHSASALRRGWKKTPMANIAKQKARKAIGRYECAQCKELFKDKEVQIDHIDPVIEISAGFVDLDTFAKRLFCDESNLQILCKPCHLKKSNEENKLRRDYKKGKKK
jgi:hypothetical protein